MFCKSYKKHTMYLNTKPNQYLWFGSVLWPKHQQIIFHNNVIKWKHYRVTDPLWGESAFHRWILLTRTSQWRGIFMFSLICAWTNVWANIQDTEDLIRYRARYDVIVMLEAGRSIGYASKTHLKVESREISFAHNTNLFKLYKASKR